MRFIWQASHHFNLANLFTMVNITCGLAATFFITQNDFFTAIVFAWIGGAFDIFDGKIARRYGLSNAFGIQLDSFADFLSFVLVPVFLIFQAVFSGMEGVAFAIAAAFAVAYVIAGLRRLIQFNINAEEGEVATHFTGVPTPLGAILLWICYLGFIYGVLPAFGVVVLMGVIGWLLNSDVKVPHP